jgi:hypothetical protein
MSNDRCVALCSDPGSLGAAVMICSEKIRLGMIICGVRSESRAALISCDPIQDRAGGSDPE